MIGFEWGGVGGVIQNQRSPDFRFPEVGISVLVVMNTLYIKLLIIFVCLLGLKLMSCYIGIY